jgi:vacuolar-type H+-ATPase subunit I/STV1
VQKVAGSNPVRSIILFNGKQFYLKAGNVILVVWMSGVDVSKVPKEDKLYACASCMNNVVQTFNHLQEQIAQLKREKANLQEEMMLLRDELEEQKRVMAEEIIVLDEKLASQKNR